MKTKIAANPILNKKVKKKLKKTIRAHIQPCAQEGVPLAINGAAVGGKF